MLDSSIVIIDYNMGNLRSVQKAFEKLGENAVISKDCDVIRNASKVVLPGVGAFRDGMRNLEALGLIEVLNQVVIQEKKTFLGICLGMQLISRKSCEHGETDGLSWVDAEVVEFDFASQEKKLKVPHTGWNNISYKKQDVLFQNVLENSDLYFVHSYYFQTNENIVTSTTNYGGEFVSSVTKENIYAVQFHPEKSQSVGLRVLKNFINIEIN